MRRFRSRHGCAVFLLFAGDLLAGTQASVDREARSFSIGNASVERALTLDGEGRYRTARFGSASPPMEWIDGGSPSGEFRLWVRQDALPGAPVCELTGESGWTLAGSASGVRADGSAVLDVALDAAALGVRVSLRYEAFPEAAAIRTLLVVANRGTAPLTLLRADVPDLRLTDQGEPLRLLSVRNFTWAHVEDALQTRDLPLLRKQAWRLETGPFGTDAAWFAVRATASGAGLFGGWEWSGSGELTIHAETGGVRVSMGLAPGTFSHVLLPGESFTAPAAFLGLFRGSWDDAAQATRDLVEARYAPPLPSPDFPYAAFDTWGYDLDIDEALVHRLVDQAADLGAELFTLDAGWMERLGDWVPRAGRFDGGIAAIADHVHARGMKFGLWVAFGTADPASAVLSRHPDWVASAGGTPIESDFGGLALCLADSEVRDWVQADLDRIVTDYRVDWLVHDFRVIVRCDDARHGHQAGDGDWASTAGFYSVLDELRRRHPGLLVENCWDGGSMLDFGMVRRHEASSLNDRCDALGNRVGVYGASYFLPPRYLEKYIGDDGRPDRYRFLSGVPGGPMILMGALTHWAPETLQAASEAVARFRSLRPLLRDGRVGHVSPPPGPDSSDALAASLASDGQGVVIAFRSSEGAAAQLVFRPPDLDAAARYDVLVYYDFVGWSRVDTLPGGLLRQTGVTVEIPTPETAAMVQLSRGRVVSRIRLRRDVMQDSRWLVVMLGIAALPPISLSAAEARPPSTRSFWATYVGTIAPVPATAKRAELWIPLPSDGPYQTVTELAVEAPAAYTLEKDSAGNRLAHFVLDKPEQLGKEIEVRARYRVTRHEVVRPNVGVASNDAASYDEDLKENKMVPLTPRVRTLAKELSAGKTDPVAKAKAFYDYLVDSGTYDKTEPGWGKGDSERFCDVKKGNCTDFHSAFMALARAERIPVRFHIGFPLKPEKEGAVPGYHCWVTFRVPGVGWIPIDASDAAKLKDPAKKSYLFGNLDPDRFDITTGRDLTLSPPQKDGPLNFFIYPYVEVDGKAFVETKIRLEYRGL